MATRAKPKTASRLLFEGAGAPPPRFAVLNHDDEYGRRMPAKGTGVFWYGLGKGATVRATDQAVRTLSAVSPLGSRAPRATLERAGDCDRPPGWDHARGRPPVALRPCGLALPQPRFTTIVTFM